MLLLSLLLQHAQPTTEEVVEEGETATLVGEEGEAEEEDDDDEAGTGTATTADVAAAVVFADGVAELESVLMSQAKKRKKM